MNHDIYVLGIETSCDETAAAVVKNGKEILSNIVASQMESHKRFGGVVPEIASRHHVEQITFVIEEAMNKAGVSFSQLSAIAVTQGPGLVGALLIGVNAAKALSFAYNIPLVGVHHIAGHIYANRLVAEMKFPLLSLVVSGGHTELVYMEKHGKFQVIGETRDDAAGEAYDKVARALNLPYPGGPHIDRLAQEGKATIDLPRAWLEEGSYDFSFSGLKSAVLNTLHNAKQRGEEIDPKDMAASFQASVIDVLVTKTIQAAKEYHVRQVLLAGGVAANRGLRTELQKQMAKLDNVELVIPPLSLCTDNAAMIAAAGTVLYMQGKRADMALNANPGLELE
ncbi:tRNA (adenosine(37)-N6)-threonylcarbamoyltransferase complex transferase subunit TsaD [Parageobacillus sp. VR-IP]|jgi:N6-L-threonylcarbamoyladenine synthase|uniref:tRNA N6-adenosine threonylcarbamoyltransferase n=1 Tax=Parageobacillus caldoxylosilyticus NBRC 107762 TaxID=1220594 RepID=A0A023DJJ0_9BACL|nr:MULTISPECIES: tRNA (adenosine(37)-N6)-threonylcarbamoyltransferase complex transferase subunit TsaD [Parageobacillus]OQP00259.1 tRNA (adenosine(37)-N6)-threonylcarbamoyltransferase complex transferase subunit TsaD [Geobacillus sp. 44B]MBB3854373.1 N6-L-threonylcarbamoyladenine synthase [Parageobacillus caldoxylosilyticus]NUK32134.1 tRNA (adenosine(37)-N6)-threonylcarbamoyltransferase complex transferase subunit TsaD [Parageobacillus sp. VR-IP]QNU38497.1 tRNA (adenosine(37)-N6)-threonylcarbam